MARSDQRRQQCSRKGRRAGAKTLEIEPHRGQATAESRDRDRRRIEREERRRGRKEIQDSLEDI